MATLKHILWSVIFPFSYFKYKAEKDVVSGPVWTWRVPCGTGKMPPTGCSAGLFTRIHTPLFFVAAGGHVGLGKDFTEVLRKGSVVSVASGGCTAAGSGNQVGSRAHESVPYFRDNNDCGVSRAPGRRNRREVLVFREKHRSSSKSSGRSKSARFPRDRCSL